MLKGHCLKYKNLVTLDAYHLHLHLHLEKPEILVGKSTGMHHFIWKV